MEETMPLSIKIPPHNLDAERAILGGVLINNDAMNQVMDILVPDDFYRDVHKTLFKGIIDLYNRNEPIDVTTLSQYLMAKNALD
jgi:replicative DNA helicase